MRGAAAGHSRPAPPAAVAASASTPLALERRACAARRARSATRASSRATAAQSRSAPTAGATPPRAVARSRSARLAARRRDRRARASPRRGAARARRAWRRRRSGGAARRRARRWRAATPRTRRRAPPVRSRSERRRRLMKRWRGAARPSLASRAARSRDSSSVDGTTPPASRRDSWLSIARCSCAQPIVVAPQLGDGALLLARAMARWRLTSSARGTGRNGRSSIERPGRIEPAPQRRAPRLELAPRRLQASELDGALLLSRPALAQPLEAAGEQRMRQHVEIVERPARLELGELPRRARCDACAARRASSSAWRDSSAWRPSPSASGRMRGAAASSASSTVSASASRCVRASLASSSPARSTRRARSSRARW